jgi:Ca-activated chloride channel family protein
MGAHEDNGAVHVLGIIGPEGRPRMRVRVGAIPAGLLVLAFLGAAIGAPAQEPPTYTESAGAEYVLMPVLVFDGKGRFVDGLDQKDFRVRVDGSAIQIDTFDRDDAAPVSFAFLLDTSGSMQLARKLETAKNAIRSIIRTRQRGDDFALFAFSEGAVRLVTDFAADPSRLLRELYGLEASGRTALFDAVATTPSRLVRGKNGKRAILLFTDGVDNASEIDAVKMAEILQQVSVPVYTVGMKNGAFGPLTDKEREELSVDNLRMLAASSGGKMFLVSGEEDLRPVAAQIGAEVRKQYLLGFTPTGRGEVKYRIVFVSLAKPGRWDVRVRRGYRGTAPAAAGLAGQERRPG